MAISNKTPFWALEMHGVSTSLAMRKADGFDSHKVHHLYRLSSEGEQLLYTQKVSGSTPLGGTRHLIGV